MMTETEILALPIVLHYRKLHGFLFLLLGTINVVLSVWLLLLGSFSLMWLVGLVIGFLGFSYLTKPCFSVTTDEVALYNLLGFKMKSYPLNSLSDLTIQNRKLYINSGGNSKKISIVTWMINPNDWKKLERIVEQSR